jgi:hypothetical protein
MSMNGAGQCGICGAWSDYCTLEPPRGPSVDCRDLMLRPGVQPERGVNASTLAANADNAKPTAVEPERAESNSPAVTPATPSAYSDYCTLDTAAGPSVDCRDLMLRPGVQPLEPVREESACSMFQNAEAARTGRSES